MRPLSKVLAMHLTRLCFAQSALSFEGEGCFEEQNALKNGCGFLH